MTQLNEIKDFLNKKVVDAHDPRVALFSDMVTFMEAIAANDHMAADEAMNRIARESQGELYKEVGKITRKLHDSVKSFKESIDPKLKELAASEMPNAIDKLQLVISETENAANKTMGIVEKHMISMGTLGEHIAKLEGPAESIAFFKSYQTELDDDLVTILTTQQFQDLTGQTIKKVIRLVGDIEGELVKLVTTFSEQPKEAAPAVAAAAQEETVSQSDVDDLLRELGF